MINYNDLKNLCKIGGFEIESDRKDKILLDINEMIGVMDKIKDFGGGEEYIVVPRSLSDLREDKPLESDFDVNVDITVARVVQGDD